MSVDIQAACSVHPDHQAVAACQRCTRAACLVCAVPFRGAVLCRECAHLEVQDQGSAAPVPASVPRRLDVVTAAFLGVALAATIFPWHRFGILTAILSAWRPEGGWWAPAGSVSFLLGAVAAVWRARRPGRARGLLRASTVLAAAGTVATAAAVLTAPAFASPSPAPFVAMGAGGVAFILGLAGLRRRAA